MPRLVMVGDNNLGKQALSYAVGKKINSVL